VLFNTGPPPVLLACFSPRAHSVALFAAATHGQKRAENVEILAPHRRPRPLSLVHAQQEFEARRRENCWPSGPRETKGATNDNKINFYELVVFVILVLTFFCHI
jgi:hypothetical protein